MFTDPHSGSINNNHRTSSAHALIPHINNNFNHINFDLDSYLMHIHSDRIDSSLIDNIHFHHSLCSHSRHFHSSIPHHCSILLLHFIILKNLELEIQFLHFYFQWLHNILLIALYWKIIFHFQTKSFEIINILLLIIIQLKSKILSIQMHRATKKQYYLFGVPTDSHKERYFMKIWTLGFKLLS